MTSRINPAALALWGVILACLVGMCYAPAWGDLIFAVTLTVAAYSIGRIAGRSIGR